MKYYDSDIDEEELKKDYQLICSNYKIRNAEELKKKCFEYFQEMEIKEKPFTIPGLALKLGITTETLNNYAKNYGNTEYADILNLALQKIEEYNHEKLYDSKSFQGAKSILKNYYKFKDKVEIETDVQVKRLEDVII